MLGQKFLIGLKVLMKLEIEIDLKPKDKPPKKDGQIAVKVTKEVEERFKILNIKNKYALNEFMREFAMKLVDEVEKSGIPEAS